MLVEDIRFVLDTVSFVLVNLHFLLGPWHAEVLRAAGKRILHHVNGDRRNNRRFNLRLIRWAANNYYRKVKANRSTGIRGVSIYKDGKIVVLIGTGGKRKCYKTLEEGIEARDQFENTMRALIMTPVKRPGKVLRRSKSKLPK